MREQRSDLERARCRERVPGRVTFVVPTRDNARTITACVASARAQEGDVEVIVVDNSSQDATRDLARAAGADLVIVAGPERSAQRNRGAEAASGEYVAFIDSDMVLEGGVAVELRRAFDAPGVGAVVLPETSFGDGYLAGCRALEKRLYLGLASAEAARGFRSSVLDQVGAYDESVTAFEDYEMPDRVQAAGWAVGRTRSGVRHDEGRISLRRLWRKKLYYGTWWSAVGTAGFNRGRLVRLPLRPLVVLRDPVHLPGLVLLKLVDVVGLAAGHRMGRKRPRSSPAC